MQKGLELHFFFSINRLSVNRISTLLQWNGFPHYYNISCVCIYTVDGYDYIWLYVYAGQV